MDVGDALTNNGKGLRDPSDIYDEASGHVASAIQLDMLEMITEWSRITRIACDPSDAYCRCYSQTFLDLVRMRSVPLPHTCKGVINVMITRKLQLNE